MKEIYQIVPMKKEDIPSSLALWRVNFTRFCGRGQFPDFYPGGKDEITAFLAEQIERGNAIAAKDGDKTVGYIAWLYINFHGEKSAFCPTVGHAAVRESEADVYRALYTAASRRWVINDCFNHLWMTFYDDVVLADLLYVLGFGSYVVDACRKLPGGLPQAGSACRITKLDKSDADILLRLAEESNGYYLEAPIFLNREGYSPDEIRKILLENHVFAAWDGSDLAGAMCLSAPLNGYNRETLTCPKSGCIDTVGAYIRPEYRGVGIGTSLLREVIRYGEELGMPYLHVSFEAANLYAQSFWPKYFKPAIRSVRRCVNKDAHKAR